MAAAFLAVVLFVYRTMELQANAQWLAKPRATVAVTKLSARPTAKRPSATLVANSPADTPQAITATLSAPTPGATPAPTEPLPEAAQLAGIRHQQQTWNNCGPATLSMMLSYFGLPDTQQVIGAALKPYKDDKNVSPDALLSYAHEAGLQAKMIVGGDIDLLKRLVAHDYPVIVESWFIPEPGDEMGHYQLVVGYDGETLNFFDSYHGPNVQHSVAEFDGLWRVFNRLVIVVWRPEQEDQMRSLLGPRWDEAPMLALALADAQREGQADPRDKFAWFNRGSTLLRQGDSAGATQAYDQAIALKLPWRMLWYQFGVYEAYLDQRKYDEVIELTSATLRVKAGLEESLYWRGMAYAAQGKTKLASADFKQALVYRGNYAEAQKALRALQTPE